MGRVRSALTWLGAAGCLAWVLHDIDAAAFGQGVRGIRWSWVATGLLFDVLSYVGQGWRWGLLLDGLTAGKATQAVYAGLFTNEVLPLRLGEAVRAWLARRWSGVHLKTVIGSMATERVFDAVWLAAGLALASQWIALPPAWAATGRWLALAAALAALAFLMWRREARVTGAFLVSALVLLGQALAFASIAKACSIPLPIWKTAVSLLIVRTGTAIPNAPANVGSYQFFTVVGLTWLGVAKSQAMIFSVVVFVLLTLPLWLLGFLALRSAGYSLTQIRQEMRSISTLHFRPGRRSGIIDSYAGPARRNLSPAELFDGVGLGRRGVVRRPGRAAPGSNGGCQGSCDLVFTLDRRNRGPPVVPVLAIEHRPSTRFAFGVTVGVRLRMTMSQFRPVVHSEKGSA
jgi:hypothetical protein